jgi:fructosamine-3-kinase
VNVNEKILQEKIDPHLTPQNLQIICSTALGEQVEVDKINLLTGGCLNRVIGIDLKAGKPSLVLKANPNIEDPGLHNEFQVLKYFSMHTSMPVAKPFYFDGSGKLIPGTFYMTNRIEGMVMHQAMLSPQHFNDVLSQITKIVVELHQIKSDGYGFVEASGSSREKAWADFWLPRFDTSLKKVLQGGHVSTQIIERINTIRPELKKMLQIGSRSTLTHYDIWSGNVMLDKQNGKLVVTGFLDVQGYWADYAREISFMEMFGLADETFYKIYCREHQLDDGFEFRKNLYNLKMNLIHVNMYPEQMYYQLGAERCLFIVEEALSTVY